MSTSKQSAASNNAGSSHKDDLRFTQTWHVAAGDIDHYGHVNNTAYIKQMESVAWAHSASLGLTISDYKALDRAMIIRSHKIKYLRACHLGDVIELSTWISHCDNRLRLNRTFSFSDNRTNQQVLSATTEYICTTLSDGRPAKMPDVFQRIYGSHAQSSPV